MPTQTDLNQLSAIASRLREMREILGWTPEDMAEKTEVTPEEYLLYEAGKTDMPFTFIYKSAQAFNMELTELLEGQNAFLSTYTVTRRGKGETTAREEGIAGRDHRTGGRHRDFQPGAEIPGQDCRALLGAV